MLSIGVSFTARINCVVLFMLNVYGRGVNWLILGVISFDKLYTGAFRQFTLGRIGCVRLQNYILLLMLVACSG